MGDQFIESVDSAGANIAEGYGRFHYLDKTKFYYIARASLTECRDHWLKLLYKRGKISDTATYKDFNETAASLSMKLNSFIAATHAARRS